MLGLTMITIMTSGMVNYAMAQYQDKTSPKPKKQTDKQNCIIIFVNKIK